MWLDIRTIVFFLGITTFYERIFISFMVVPRFILFISLDLSLNSVFPLSEFELFFKLLSNCMTLFIWEFSEETYFSTLVMVNVSSLVSFLKTPMVFYHFFNITMTKKKKKKHKRCQKIKHGPERVL